MPTVWSQTAALLITSAHFHCTQLHSLPRRRIAMQPFPRNNRLSDPSHSFALCPPAPTLHPISPTVLLCGALSSKAVLPCTLLSPLLCRLTLLPSQCRLKLSPGRSGQSYPPFRKHRFSDRLQTPSEPSTPHRIARACSVSDSGMRGLTWTPSLSPGISASLTATSSTVTTSPLAQLAPTHTSPPPLAFVVVTSRAAKLTTP
jgi:hypothetical protein